MARQIIILERQENLYGLVSVRAVFWVTVLSDDALPKPNFVSSVLGAPFPAGAAPDATELAALRAGTTIELVFAWLYAGTKTNAAIRTELEGAYAAVQAAVAANPPGVYYGAAWNGSVWTT